ncbi:hypothetical protein KM043_007380 [Ampulex compressa]|nr:hypothetical protein KM043_007380 [Ampulex compressa]
MYGGELETNVRSVSKPRARDSREILDRGPRRSSWHRGFAGRRSRGRRQRRIWARERGERSLGGSASIGRPALFVRERSRPLTQPGFLWSSIGSASTFRPEAPPYLRNRGQENASPRVNGKKGKELRYFRRKSLARSRLEWPAVARLRLALDPDIPFILMRRVPRGESAVIPSVALARGRRIPRSRRSRLLPRRPTRTSCARSARPLGQPIGELAGGKALVTSRRRARVSSTKRTDVKEDGWVAANEETQGGISHAWKKKKKPRARAPVKVWSKPLSESIAGASPALRLIPAKRDTAGRLRSRGIWWLVGDGSEDPASGERQKRFVVSRLEDPVLRGPTLRKEPPTSEKRPPCTASNARTSRLPSKDLSTGAAPVRIQRGPILHPVFNKPILPEILAAIEETPYLENAIPP